MTFTCKCIKLANTLDKKLINLSISVSLFLQMQRFWLKMLVKIDVFKWISRHNSNWRFTNKSIWLLFELQHTYLKMKNAFRFHIIVMTANLDYMHWTMIVSESFAMLSGRSMFLRNGLTQVSVIDRCFCYMFYWFQ